MGQEVIKAAVGLSRKLISAGTKQAEKLKSLVNTYNNHETGDVKIEINIYLVTLQKHTHSN